MPKLEILIGMIASGKSTFCRKRAAAGAIIVSDDALTFALSGGLYHFKQETRPLIELAMIETAALGLMAGYDVVIDSTNHVREKREWFIDMAKECDVKDVRAIVFPKLSPTVHAKRRFAAESRGVFYDTWLIVATLHSEQWQDVTEDEGFTLIEPAPAFSQ